MPSPILLPAERGGGGGGGDGEEIFAISRSMGSLYEMLSQL